MNVQLFQRFARLTTNVVVSRPELWRFLRSPIRSRFDQLAPQWDQISSPDRLAPLERALDSLPSPPTRVLDVGTGTGNAALLLARRFPDAHVTGVDLSPEMVEHARAKVQPELSDRTTFSVADASHLPFDDNAFDLVVLANMIPFFGELARVTARGGAIVLSYSRGPQTPIYVPLERVQAELKRRGFADFATFAVGDGVALLARRSAAG